MATRIRLRRMGRAKRPVFSIVVVDSRKARDSSYIEDLGRYYPLEEPGEVRLKQERAMHWLRSGAQPSDTVRGIFSDQGLMLRLHLERKGTSEEEIERIVAEWEEDRGEDAQKFDVTTEAELKEQAEEASVEEEAEAEETVEEETEAEAPSEEEEAEAEEAEEEEAEEEEADVEAVHKAQAEASKEEAAAASEREVEEAKEQEETQEEREA